jgi:putative transposase
VCGQVRQAAPWTDRGLHPGLTTPERAELPAAKRGIAELTTGRGLIVGHGTVELLMARAGPKGATGAPRWRRARPDLFATDLVDRRFTREGVDQLWVTDTTAHRTREGKVYGAVVLDVCSRRLVGWSIDSSPTAALVTNALGMAIDTRRPAAGTIIHSPQRCRVGQPGRRFQLPGWLRAT